MKKILLALAVVFTLSGCIMEGPITGLEYDVTHGEDGLRVKRVESEK